MLIETYQRDARRYQTTLGNGAVLVTSGAGGKQSGSGGVIVPGNHHDPNNFAYTINRWEYMRGRSVLWQGNYKTGYDSEGGIQTGYTNRAFDDLFNFPSDVYNSALTKLNEKTRGSIDLSIDAFQGKQTLKMLNVVKRYRDYALKVDWRSLAKQASSLRLEYVYGWAPMASTLYNAIDEVYRSTLKQTEAFTARASRDISNLSSSVELVHTGSTPCVFERSGRHLCEIKVLLAQQGFDPARWTSLNPVSIGYELIPYSFVLDWFIDVGSYIRDVETAMLYGNVFRGGYVTRLTACDAKCNVSFDRFSKGGWRYFGFGSSSGRYLALNRSLLASYPLPRLPTFKADLGSSRLLSAAALLAQHLGTSPKTRR